ncbi:hypothetical protein CLN94_05930 [Pseudothioclava arenosa]|uniref:Uncharacterized protein n=1 Tax=Pseudothioclava arenosa TaxID=1795308 RepID=A0A2A4CT17_9RHOB|nr:hypothetical protein CLN94_05930 [Pseudothioclava arenosa]
MSFVQARELGLLAWQDKRRLSPDTPAISAFTQDLLRAEVRLRLDLLHCHRASSDQRGVV